MYTLADANDVAFILVVILLVVGIPAVLGLIGWKIYRLMNAVTMQGSPEEKNKAIAKAMYGDNAATDLGYEAGKKARERLNSMFKSKGKQP